MNDIQCFIDRQLGIYSRFNYDNILKRLMVTAEESFYGLQSSVLPAPTDQDPPIFACRFSEAPGFEHILALANEDGRVAIQDTRTARSACSLESFQCHNNAVFDLAWMPKNMNFVTVSGDHTASLWDIGEGAPKQVLVFTHHTKSVKTAVFRPNEPSVFATGARDGHILVWDIRANNQPFIVVKPDNCLMNCHSSFTPKTPGSHGKRPRIDSHRAISITGLVFQDDLTLISCGECDGNIKVWDMRKNYNIYTREPLPKHSIPYCGGSTRNGYTNLIIDETRTRLYASCMDSVIYCFNISTYNALPHQRYVGHENGTFYIKTGLSPDGTYLVSGSSDKNAYVWNVRWAEPVVRLVGHHAEVTCAAWGHQLVTCSDDARHYIWRIGPEFQPAGEAPPPGRAEPVPRTTTLHAPRCLLPATPTSLKRRATPSTGTHAKRVRTVDTLSSRKTKRCLADLMNASKHQDGTENAKRIKLESANASRDQDGTEGVAKRCLADLMNASNQDGTENAKRIKLEPAALASNPQLLPAGIKRRRTTNDCTTPEKKCLDTPHSPTNWTYIAPRAGTSFMTPTKKYERKTCKVLSPKSPKPITSKPGSPRSPVKVSPTKVRVITFTTPTKNLPNFVLDGEAPHQRLMSPIRKKQDTTNWLTLMVREKKGKGPDLNDKANVTAPLSPKENVPTRRNSVTERTPKSNNKRRTLLKYFSVTPKDK